MKIKLLPSTFDADGRPSSEQRLSCYIIDDAVAVDAGSLAFGLSAHERHLIRDVIITHTHIDHIASLPIFIDDAFELLEDSIRIHATAETIEHLERDIFNWSTYPRFTELHNGRCTVMEYVPFVIGEEISVKHLRIATVLVDHAVPTVGLLISSGDACIAYSSDTRETEAFWHLLNQAPRLDALFVEASFPNSMQKLAEVAGHLTPAALDRELHKLHHATNVYAVHIKPSHRDTITRELAALGRTNLQVMEVGLTYEW